MKFMATIGLVGLLVGCSRDTRQQRAGEEGAEEHLPTLTPLARSLAANTALARSRSSSAVAAGGQSPESRED